MPDEGPREPPALAKSLAACERALAQSGKSVAVSGLLHRAGGLLAVHSDYGPPDQDKDTNQDYALAWAPNDDEPGSIRWAIALADGVTASFAAEWGARLACWSALAALIEQADQLAGMDLARSSIDVAGATIRRLAGDIEAAGDAYRPQDEFPSTWEFILAEGLLLQTTLTLAWLQDGTLHLAMVGDGGAALREGSGENRNDVGLVAGVPQTSRVHALGPKNHQVSELDVWHEHRLPGPALVALYTDGIRAGVGDNVGTLLDRLERALDDPSLNAAQFVVEEFIASGREEFHDNLTLAVIRWEA